MISKTIGTMLLVFAVLQVSQARTYCDCEIEYDGEDPDIVFTEFKQCTYREYESIRIEVESTECESSSSGCEEKQSLLKKLEMARYQLDAFMCKLNKSILKRMKEAYLRFGSTTCSEYKSLVADILSETESEVKQQMMEFRNSFTKCKSFFGSIVSNISNKFKSKAKGIFGSKGSSSSSPKFCDCDIEYSGEDPEIILNEIRKTTYKEYNSVKRELESMECEESSPKYEEKQAMCKELEMSRFHLEEYLCDLGVTVLERMKAAYLEYGGAVSPEFKSLIVDVLSKTEAQVRPYLEDFRKGFSRFRSFIGGKSIGGSGSDCSCKSSGGSGNGCDCVGIGGGSGGSDGGCGCGGEKSVVSKTRKFCDYDIEFCDEDPDIVLAEVTQCAYREYVNIKNELESTECDSSSSKYEEKQSLLKELEMARYQLEEYINNKNKLILERLSEAHLKFGSTTCSEYRSLVAEISSEIESEMNQHIMEFRNSFTKCNSFVSSVMGKISNKLKSMKSITKGIFGGKSSSSTRKFCEYDVQYVGDDPEIILNEIRMSTYREYVSVKKELESMECEKSSSRYEEKFMMLKELESSRFHLETYLCDLGVSMLERMKAAYLEYGGAVSPEFKSLIVQVMSEAEAQVRPYLQDFRKEYSRCRTFAGSGAVGLVKRATKELVTSPPSLPGLKPFF